MANITPFYNIVIPEVQVMASRQHVNIGASVTFSCSVNRTNPEVSTYVWTNENGSTVMVGENITIIFSSTNNFGTYRCTVNNTAGFSGSDNVTIEQGCKLEDINIFIITSMILFYCYYMNNTIVLRIKLE